MVKKLPPHTWDSNVAVAYEATQELINDVIGCYVALLNHERASSRPDPERIRQLRAQIADCDQRQRTLDPGEESEIAAVRSSYRHVLDGLRAELR
ncbi:hypothetical protein DMP15_29630 [Pseudonocardia sp. UM4_GMWB1]